MKHELTLVACALCLSACTTTPMAPAVAEGPSATAVVRPASGSQAHGSVKFTQVGNRVKVEGEIAGLNPGRHGFHIHEKGDCSAADAASAGPHFNPGGKKHGGTEGSERHGGDLGNLTANEYGKATISVIVIWFASGLTMLILTGGMQGIPRELYEAADVDGASWLKKELRITIPLLRRSIALSLIISVIGSFLAFNQFFILAQNNVSLETVVEWIYQTGFSSYRLGYATAMALFLVVIIGIVSMGQFLVLRDETEL